MREPIIVSITSATAARKKIAAYRELFGSDPAVSVCGIMYSPDRNPVFLTDMFYEVTNIERKYLTVSDPDTQERFKAAPTKRDEVRLQLSKAR